jgi:hypothetical protein
MPTYDGFGPAISRPPNEAITVVSTEPLATRARLFVKLTASDRVAKAHIGDFVDGVVEYAVEYTGDDFADSAVGVAIGGFPFVRVAEDIDAGDRLRPAADGSGYAEKAAPGERAAAIARTSATAASDAPFVRAQLLARPQQVGGALTENAGVIGGVNDGDLPNLAPTAIAIADNTTGVADLTDPATLAVITNPDLSAWNAGTDPTAAQATAITAGFTSVKNAFASMAVVINQLRADNASLRAGVREVAAKVNAVVS